MGKVVNSREATFFPEPQKEGFQFFSESQRCAISVLRGQTMLLDRSCAKVQLHEISLRSLGNSSTKTSNENCEILGRKENLLDRREKIDGGNVLPEPVKEDVQPIQESS